MWPAADEKRKNSLQMIDLLMLIVIAACLLCIIFSGMHHRRRALESGETCGSLWYHIRQCISDDKRRKVSWLKTQIATPQTAPLANDRTLQVTLVEVEIQATQVPSRTKKKKKREFRGEAADVDEIQFSYPNREGPGYAPRHVSVWAVDEDYLEGYCHKRQRKRTFSLLRIRGKVTSMSTGEIQSVEKWASTMRLLPNNRIVTDGASHRPVGIKVYPPGKANQKQWETAACFVGFSDAKRCELESMAKEVGWQVRMEFSASLDILIAGPLAGHVQLRKAKSFGINTISESDFKKRIAEK